MRALAEGRRPSGLEVLRRSVASHAVAAGLDLVSATGRQLRMAQRGPRLGNKPEDGHGSSQPSRVKEHLAVAVPVPQGALAFGPRYGGALVAAARRAGPEAVRPLGPSARHAGDLEKELARKAKQQAYGGETEDENGGGQDLSSVAEEAAAPQAAEEATAA